jgi:DNA-binding CsgD family transcriptional regulator
MSTAVDRLTATERAAALLVAEGARNKDIATALRVSEMTAKNVLMGIYRRMELPPQRNHRVLLALAMAAHGRAEDGR